MHYRYDNSVDNPHNPSSPPRQVVFGSETTDEMGELLVQVLTQNAEDAAQLRAQVARKNLLTDVAGEEKRIADRPADYETHNALGVAYVQLGRCRKRSTSSGRLVACARSCAGCYNIGVIAMGEQRIPEAIASFEHAIAARPDYAEAHNNLGVAFEADAARRRSRAAIPRGACRRCPVMPPRTTTLDGCCWRAATWRRRFRTFGPRFSAAPTIPTRLYNLGRALVAEGHEAEAVQVWRRAIAARPDSLAVLVDAAWLLATNASVQNADAAVTFAEKANQVSGGGNPAVLDVLAAAYASQGRLDVAARTAQRAFQRALAMKNDKLAGEIRQRLETYQDARGRRSLGSGAITEGFRLSNPRL